MFALSSIRSTMLLMNVSAQGTRRAGDGRSRFTCRVSAGAGSLPANDPSRSRHAGGGLPRVDGSSGDVDPRRRRRIRERDDDTAQRNIAAGERGGRTVAHGIAQDRMPDRDPGDRAQPTGNDRQCRPGDEEALVPANASATLELRECRVHGRRFEIRGRLIDRPGRRRGRAGERWFRRRGSRGRAGRTSRRR